MIAYMLAVLVGKWRETLRLRYRMPYRRNELEGAPFALVAKKLAPDFVRENLCKKGWYGVSEHFLHVRPAAVELKPVRERLEAAHFPAG